MRILKFKGVSKNKLFPLLGINTDNNSGLCQVEGVVGWCWCGFDKIIQYTGLKDKNEKEIYEGDVLT